MGLTNLPDGKVQADPYDLLGIVKNTATGRYHVTLWLEHPLPSVGWADEKCTGPIRLKSTMHHEAGFVTLEEAVGEIKRLRQNLIIDDVCVLDTPDSAFSKNFEEGHASVIYMGNWRNEAKGLAQKPPTPEPEPKSRWEHLLEDDP
jgi:hypothetical protein